MFNKNLKFLGLFVLAFSLLITMAACDSSEPVGDISETYNVLITIENVVDEDHADLFSVSANGESGIDQFYYEEDTLTGSLTDLEGSVELTLVINNDDLDNGKYTIGHNTLEVDLNNSKAKFEVDYYSLLLEDGNLITGDDEITFGAVKNSLNENLGINLEKNENTQTKNSLNKFLNDIGGEQISDIYNIDFSRKFNNSADKPVLISFSIPEGISHDDLIIGVSVPEESVRYQNSLSAWSGWEHANSFYDKTKENIILPVTDIIEEQKDLVVFKATSNVDYYESDNFIIKASTSDWQPEEFQLKKAAEILEEAYDYYVKTLGFKEPRLTKTTLDKFSMIKTGLENYQNLNLKYTIELRDIEIMTANGIYNPYKRSLNVALKENELPSKEIIRHEFFHSIQYSFDNFYKNYVSWDRDKFGGLGYADLAFYEMEEALTVAAENSIGKMMRSKQAEYNIDTKLFNEHMSEENYNWAPFAQDFWVFLSRKITPEDPQIDFLIPIYEAGGLVSDLEDFLTHDDTFNDLGDAYWQFIKNQAFERKINLGYNVPLDKELQNDFNKICYWHDVYGNLEEKQWHSGEGLESFSLKTLQSKLFKITINSEDLESNKIKVNLDSANDSIKYKFYPVFTYDDYKSGRGPHDPSDYWVDWEDDYCKDEFNDNESQNFKVTEGEVSFYLLVSNTNRKQNAENITINIEELENEFDDQFSFELKVEGDGYVEINNDYEGESWIVSDEIKIDDIKADTEIRLKANPDDGWEFSHWDGNLTNMSNDDSSSIIISKSDKSILVEKDIQKIKKTESVFQNTESPKKTIVMDNDKYLKAVFNKEEKGETIKTNISGKILGDRKYSVDQIEAIIFKQVDDNSSWRGIEYTNINANGEFEFQNLQLDIESNYKVGFWPDKSIKSYYIETYEDLNIDSNTPVNYELEEIEMNTGSCLHLIVKDSNGNKMENTRVDVSATTGGWYGFETNNEGEIYYGLIESDDSYVKVSITDGENHDNYEEQVFEGITFNYREKTTLVVQF